MLFTQIMHKKQTQKINIFNLTVQYLEKYSSTSTTAGIQGLASSEQARIVTDWGRERRWEMVGLQDLQQ